MEMEMVVDRLCRRTEQHGREASELVVAAGDARPARWRREGFGQSWSVRLEIDERDRDGNGRSGIKQPPFEIRSPALS
jgi:hypothetical protein